MGTWDCFSAPALANWGAITWEELIMACKAKPVLTLKEASEQYRMSPKVLRKLLAAGELHGLRQGVNKGKLFIYEASLEAYRERKSTLRPEPAAAPVPQQKGRRPLDGGFQVFHLP
jgi:Helix-turn-helix domain